MSRHVGTHTAIAVLKTTLPRLSKEEVTSLKMNKVLRMFRILA